MKRQVIPALLVVLALAFGVAGSPHGSKDERQTDDRGVLQAIAQAPVKTRRWHNPYGDRPDAVRAGEKLFLQHCAECHGSDARGIGSAVNLRLPAVQNATPGELAWFLRNGNLWRGMPSWSGLPEERRWQIEIGRAHV